jgi:hypothetical protein
MLLARMFSGVVSAFQAAELAAGEDAASGETAGAERIPLATLHEVLEAAFVLPTP